MNYELTRYGDCWRMRLLDFVARNLGLLIHVDGLPFGHEQPLETGAMSANEPSDSHSAQ